MAKSARHLQPEEIEKESKLSENLNWHEHQSDPDNWLKIPEFNVAPRDVDFVGFAWPILGPVALDFFWKVPIYDAVHAVRSEAKSRFRKLSDLKQCYLSAIMSGSFMWAPLEDEPLNWTREQVFAWRYESFFDQIKYAFINSRQKKDMSMGNIAYAMCYALDMNGNKPLDPKSLSAARSEIARAGAAISNAAHGKNKSDVYAWLDANFDCSMSHKEMSDTLEKLVPRERETILKDITAWRKIRKR